MNNIKNLMMVLFAFGLSYADTYGQKHEFLAKAVHYSQNYDYYLKKINNAVFIKNKGNEHRLTPKEKRELRNSLSEKREIARDYAKYLKNKFENEFTIDINNFKKEKFEKDMQNFLQDKTNVYIKSTNFN